jgi:hypothetical protein
MALQAVEKRHESEVKGLAKSLAFLTAKCARAEGFRRDLIFVKEWYLLQVKMFSAW